MPGKKYFPNNVRRIQQAPDDIFETHEFEEVMDWRVCNWELPDTIAAVIRCENSKTGKIKEFVYQQHKSANNKLAALTADPNNTVTIATQDAVSQLYYDRPSPWHD